MVPQWIIEKKRDGEALTEEEIRFFIEGYTAGRIPDYQAAAWAMAVYLKGMTFEETAILTDAMMRSGDLVDTSGIHRPKVDKHSTGGIGDKVSLLLAPLAACCGLAVPMISGRGLGITGGTLDKLESIPGFRTDLTEAEFVRVVEACGCCISGQTGRLAPADKKLYGLRDVTGTVPSIPLITASIMSKKLAEGIDALVLDVKWGRGAFMKSPAQARDLARTMVEVGTRMGKGMAAQLTDMNEPLGHAAGNALEIVETMHSLSGEGPEDLLDVTLALGARMLVLGGLEDDLDTARERLRGPLESGAARERFLQMIELQGGDASALEALEAFHPAPVRQSVEAPSAGIVTAVDAEALGKACLLLGAGRSRAEDAIDPAVGIDGLRKTGDAVDPGAPLATLHARARDERLVQATALVRDAFTLGQTPPTPRPLLGETILPGDPEND